MNSFWHIDLGNVATWVTLIFAAIGFMWRFSRSIDRLEDSQKTNAETLKSLSSLVDRMNSSGTNWSREKLAAETLLQTDHARRLIDLERAYKSQAPQLSALMSDVSWIKHHIQNGNKE